MEWIDNLIIVIMVLASATVFAEAPPAAVAPSPAQAVPASGAPPMSGRNLGEFDTSKPGQLKWEKNPFVQTIESIGVQDMRLTAIVYRPGSAAALINDLVVKEGDRVGDSEVVHIEAKRVVMRNENGIFSLTLGGRN
jgi:hypothetical protein